MRKIALIIISFFFSLTAFCQEESGAIKTNKGILLYFNVENNNHTLSLEGDIDLSNFPYIKLDDNFLQFIVNDKRNFMTKDSSTLSNYMNWEIDYFEEQFETELEVENETNSISDLQINFWNIKNPKIDDKEIHNPVIITFFADFIHKDFIYRFSYSSMSGIKKEANAVLKSLINGMTFYSSPLDMNKLQQAVKNGVNYYTEE